MIQQYFGKMMKNVGYLEAYAIFADGSTKTIGLANTTGSTGYSFDNYAKILSDGRVVVLTNFS